LQPKKNLLFELLKEKIVEAMLRSNPGMSRTISEWKGQDIVNFQEELHQQVNARISEKWFYTHMKAGNDKLPRIDMLNFLSQFAGYKDWNDFVYRNKGKGITQTVKSGNRYFIIVPVLVIAVMAVFYLLFQLLNTRDYVFCFYDMDTKEPVINGNIEVSLLVKGESPVQYLCDENGCFALRTNQVYVEMVVRAPYYRQDTIRRTLRKFERDERIGLRANEYAMMLKFFSEGNAVDWKKRRSKLEEMFDDAAMIYQVHDDSHATGMQLFTKREFIDRMTMPAQSLRNIDILDTKYLGEKIQVLRFRVKSK